MKAGTIGEWPYGGGRPFIGRPGIKNSKKKLK